VRLVGFSNAIDLVRISNSEKQAVMLALETHVWSALRTAAACVRPPTLLNFPSKILNNSTLRRCNNRVFIFPRKLAGPTRLREVSLPPLNTAKLNRPTSGAFPLIGKPF
jgi:hypothetical protein